MNSVVGPILIKKLLKSEICGSCKQFTSTIDVHYTQEKSQQL